MKLWCRSVNFLISMQKYILVGMHDSFGKFYCELWDLVTHCYAPHAVHIHVSQNVHN
jgi:hypothetical protein